MKLAIVVSLAATLLCACGTPQSLPVEIPSCKVAQNISRVMLTAPVTSRASKPISGLVLVADVYRDFRYQRFQGTAVVSPELDPGQQRTLNFQISGKILPPEGPAMRCFATHIAYLDGTSEDVTASR